MAQATERPVDFEAYWDEVERDLARYPAAPELEPLPLRSSDHFTVYAVKLTSVGPYRLFGYYSVPTGAGPFPGLYQTPRYGSVNHIPDYNDRLRYAVFQLMHRGQRLADQPFAAAYPGLLTLGIEEPTTFIYRSIVADCLRGAEFLLSRPEVDRRRVGIVGDDLAVITAARRPRFTLLEAANLLLYRLSEARQRTEAYPVAEVNDYLRAHPERREAVTRTLAYFDPAYHAPGVTATAMLSVGDAGSLSGPAWLQPLSDALGGQVEHYTLTHEGGTDHDWLDAWRSKRLGVEPMTRFRRVPV